MLYTTLENKQIIKSKYLNEDIINLLDLTFVLPDDFSFNVFDVTREYIARPDLVSQDAYGDTMFADIICKLNGISNPFELNEGMKIILPTPDRIMDFAAPANSIVTDFEDTEMNNNHRAPIAKSKNSKKRRANDAIVGDTRFKINPEKGIIIY